MLTQMLARERTMSLDFPSVPAVLDPLPEKLYQAIQTLEDATVILESGERTNAAHLSWLATERVALWLESQGLIPTPHKTKHGPSEHKQRRTNLSALLGISCADLDQLAGARLTDGYGNHGTNGVSKTLTDAEALRSRDTAAAVLKAVLRHPSLLSPKQQLVYGHLLDRPALRSATTDWLNLIEESVLQGKHTSSMDDHLTVLIDRYQHPQTLAQRRVAARLAFSAASRAKNRGAMSGSSGAIAWSDRALRLSKGLNDPHRVALLLRIQAIALAHIGQNDASWNRLKAAYQVAGSNEDAIHHLKNMEALFLMHMGRYREALAIAEPLVHQAELWGDQEQWSRRCLTVGRIKSRMGQYDEAETLITQSVAECPNDHIIVHAVARMSLANTYARSKALDKVYSTAKMLGSLVGPYGLVWQARRVKVIIETLEGGLDRDNLEGEDDVF